MMISIDFIWFIPEYMTGLFNQQELKKLNV